MNARAREPRFAGLAPDSAAALGFVGLSVTTPHKDAIAAAADQAAREAGVDGVPSFFLDGYSLFSGAMPAAQMAEAFRRGQRSLQQREA